MMKKMKRNPFEVCALEVDKRNATDDAVLKNWLKSIDFFAKFPDLIMDQVCNSLQPMEYRKDQLVMGKGEESTFMIVIYSGDIGIYLQTFEELEKSGIEGKCIAKKGTEGVLGEAGLLKGATRGATCIAIEHIKSLYLSASNYCKIVESFHKSELYQNIEFNKTLEFLSQISYVKARKLASCYNSLIFKKGQTIINIGDSVSQFYVLKKGRLRVEK